VSYQEKWYQEKLTLAWNPITQKIDTTIKNGFYTAREMSYGVAMTSRIFGMIGFRKNCKVQANLLKPWPSRHKYSLKLLHLITTYLLPYFF
jgi:hypothetical protein